MYGIACEGAIKNPTVMLQDSKSVQPCNSPLMSRLQGLTPFLSKPLHTAYICHHPQHTLQLHQQVLVSGPESSMHAFIHVKKSWAQHHLICLACDLVLNPLGQVIQLVHDFLHSSCQATCTTQAHLIQARSHHGQSHLLIDARCNDLWPCQHGVSS